MHNLGLGGAVVCSLLRRPEFYAEGGTDGRTRCVALLSRGRQQTNDGLLSRAGSATTTRTSAGRSPARMSTGSRRASTRRTSSGSRGCERAARVPASPLFFLSGSISLAGAKPFYDDALRRYVYRTRYGVRYVTITDLVDALFLHRQSLLSKPSVCYVHTSGVERHSSRDRASSTTGSSL